MCFLLCSFQKSYNLSKSDNLKLVKTKVYLLWKSSHSGSVPLDSGCNCNWFKQIIFELCKTPMGRGVERLNRIKRTVILTLQWHISTYQFNRCLIIHECIILIFLFENEGLLEMISLPEDHTTMLLETISLPEDHTTMLLLPPPPSHKRSYSWIFLDTTAYDIHPQSQ